MKFKLNKIEQEMIFATIDHDKDGFLSFNEFLFALGKSELVKN